MTEEADRRAPASAARTGWRGIGTPGRTALIGLAFSAVVGVAIGFLIPASVRQSLVDSEANLLAHLVDDAQAAGIVPLTTTDPDALAEFDHLVSHHVLGARTVRVKIIDLNGTIVYSDATELIGQSFPLGDQAAEVLGGSPRAVSLDRSLPEHRSEASLTDVTEFIFPIFDQRGVVVGLFELYQHSAALNSDVTAIRRTMWLAIGTGLGLMALFTGFLIVASGRASISRHKQALGILHDLLQAEEAERRRVVGALHNDIGQPLYRVLYGLEDTRYRLGEDHAVVPELDHLSDLVRGVDRTLRAEFSMLHRGTFEDDTLSAGIRRLLETTQLETDLHIDADIAETQPLPSAAEAALLRAAEEAVINIRKHAHAGSMWVRLAPDGSRLTLEVEDDGVGAGLGEGIGLTTTRERLEAIGGGLRVRSRPAIGTLITAWVQTDIETAD